MKLMKPQRQVTTTWLPYLVLFSGILVYFLFFADYVTYFQEKSSLFVFSSGYLKESLQKPGDLIVYFGNLFTSFYYSPLAGTLIIASTITLTVFLISGIIKSLNSEWVKPGVIISLLIGSILFYLQTDYRFFLFFTLGILLQAALLSFVVRSRAGYQEWIFIMVSPIWYLLTGSYTVIFLVFLSFVIFRKREKVSLTKLFVLWLLNFLVFYISKEYIFSQPVKTLLFFPFTKLIHGVQSVLLLTVIAILSALPLITSIRIRLPEKIRLSLFPFNPAVTVITGIILIITGYYQFNNKTKQYFHVEKLFYQNRFSEVIAFNTKHQTTNILTLYLNNIALCEEGKLDDQLFHFPQNKEGKTLFLKWEMVGEILRRGGYFYYTIGMINEAHRWAYENMVMKGYTPEGLKMLIRTDLLSGNYKVASIYIGILKRTLFYRKEALRFEKMLFNVKAIKADKDLGEKLQIKLKNDFFTITDNPVVDIDMILAKDSLNKQAFEYKMAYLLLKKDYKELEMELPRFALLGYKRLPAHIEEAVLAISVTNKGKMPDTGGIGISRSTLNRWEQYISVLRQYSNDIRSAEPILRKRFGDTFWYWVFFR
jgi:hypothetical protein